MKVVPELSLNGKVGLMKPASLAFAKNMKVDIDNSIVSDYGYKHIDKLDNYDIVGHIVGLDNKIYFLTSDTNTVKVRDKEIQNIIPSGEPTYTSKVISNGRFEDGSKIINDGKIFYFDITPYRNDDGSSIDPNYIPDSYKFSSIVEHTVVGTGEDFANINNRYTIKLKCDVNATDEEVEQGYVYRTREQFINKLLDAIEKVLVLNGVSLTAINRTIKAGYTLANSSIDHNFISDYDLNYDTYYIYEYPIKDTYADTRSNMQSLASYKNVEIEPIEPDDTVVEETIPIYKDVNIIVEYDELTEEIREIPCGWIYSGGSLSGVMTTNITGEKILTIAEKITSEINNEDTNINNIIPLKHINLSYCSYEDDESIYSQCPKVPIANLNIIDTYANVIPNGTYVFFIRYEIRENVYTPWYHCSRPIFAGVSEDVDTIQGSLNYINIHRDSAKSFVFNIDFVIPEYKDIYKKFQLGFILTHDDSTNARSWKTFDINTKTIYFDYDSVEEIAIEDLKNINYELYNIDNVASFKNKLYISNYKETDFNDSYLKEIAKKIDVRVIDSHNENYGENIYFNGKKLKLRPGTNDIYYQTVDGSDISSLFTLDYINLNITALNPEAKQVFNNAYEIGAYWHADAEPDIISINKLQSRVRGKQLLGNSFSNVYTNNGLKRVPSHDQDPVYALDISDNFIHPWYNLGFTFAYGSLENSDVSSNPMGAFPINKFTKTQDPKGQSGNYWIAKDRGFFVNGVGNNIKNNIKTELENFKPAVFAYSILGDGVNKVKIGYKAEYDESDYIIDRELIDKNELNSKATNDISAFLLNYIKQYLYGIKVGSGNNITFVFNINNQQVETNNLQTIYKQYRPDVNENSWDFVGSMSVNGDFSVNITPNDCKFNCTFTMKAGVVTTSSQETNTKIAQQSTLMPLSTYNVYAHFVDEHNIISNGIYIKTIKTAGVESDTSVLKLSYTIEDINFKHYKAFFLSVANVGDKIVELFGHDENYISRIDGKFYTYALEADTLTYALNDNLTLVDNSNNVITKTAKYYSSSDSSLPEAFGNVGFIAIDTTINNYEDIRYIKIPSDISGEERFKLIKATDYIPLVATAHEENNVVVQDFVVVNNGFYGSFICSVKKPSYINGSIIYANGRDVYKKDGLRLSDIDDDIVLQSRITPYYYIRSNFNFNYLDLTEDISDQIFTVNVSTNNQNNEVVATKYVIKIINSQILSYIYKIPGMYKDYDNVYYFQSDDLINTKFDNTIRVSNVLSDEAKNNSVFTFLPTDYYNIPTDRGPIVKLFSISNVIYAHTKRSLYKFDVNQTIMSSETDIQLKESDPFDTGISQVLDSEYGYGGIENKEASCITFNSYFFYDAENNHLFAYNGNGQLNLIDSPIIELLKYYKFKICRTIHDGVNNRILFEFVVPDDKKDGRLADTSSTSITISYNYIIKSFVSLHDLTLLNSFNSRNICYSYRKKLLSLFTQLDDLDNAELEDIRPTWNIYGDATSPCWLGLNNKNHYFSQSPFAISIVMFPKEHLREVINSVLFTVNTYENNILTVRTGRPPIIRYLTDAVNYQKSDNVFEDTEPLEPVKCLYINTDRCQSSDVTGVVNDAVEPNSLLEHKGFKYNNGIWAANYFRNILNSDDIYEYQEPDISEDLNNDNNSLVYGKYFIITLEFNENYPIKFENILINTNKY